MKVTNSTQYLPAIFGRSSRNNAKSGRRDRRVRPTLGGSSCDGVDALESRLVLSTGAQFHLMARAAPGTTMKKAFNIGTVSVGESEPFSNSVGKQSRSKFYEFETRSQEVFQATLSGLTHDANLTLMGSSGQVIASTTSAGASSTSVSATLSPGTYFVMVTGVSKPKVNYELTIKAKAPAVPVSNSTGTPTGTSPTSPPASMPTIPTKGVYGISVTGTAYFGSTAFPSSATQYSPTSNFNLGGVMVLSPTLDPYNASNNGINPHDVIFHTGPANSIDTGGAGVLEYATNTGLHQLFEGNASQGADVNVATVTENDSAGMIQIQPAANALVTQLNVMFVEGGLFSNPYSIVAGQIDIQFSNGGTQVKGTITLYGQGQISGGSVAIQATFQGSLQSS